MRYEAFKPPSDLSSSNVAKTAISDEELQLRKRARRRLVGAVVLVLLVVVFVPMFLDREPRQQKQDMDIQIPSVPAQAQSPAALQGLPAPAANPAPPTATTPQPAAPAPAAVEVAPAAAQPKPAAAEPAPGAAAAEAPATPKPVETSAGEAAAGAASTVPGTGGYVIRLGAFADHDRAKELLAKVKATRVQGYTEVVRTSQGTRMRVRAGPFSTVQAAEKARERLKVAKLLPNGEVKIVKKGE